MAVLQFPFPTAVGFWMISVFQTILFAITLRPPVRTSKRVPWLDCFWKFWILLLLNSMIGQPWFLLIVYLSILFTNVVTFLQIPYLPYLPCHNAAKSRRPTYHEFVTNFFNDPKAKMLHLYINYFLWNVYEIQGSSLYIKYKTSFTLDPDPCCLTNRVVWQIRFDM